MFINNIFDISDLSVLVVSSVSLWKYNLKIIKAKANSRATAPSGGHKIKLHHNWRIIL